MTNVNQEMDRVLDWGDTIEKESEFIVLPEGDYNFTVTKFERARFGGSEKMPACPQAKLDLTIHSAEHGDVVVFHNLLLHSKTEGLLSAFFIGIGQKEKGQSVKMDWSKVIGAQGRLKLKVNEYTTNSGEKRTNNQVAKFYDPREGGRVQAPVQNQQPSYQPPQTPPPAPNQEAQNFTPGSF